MNNKPVAWVTQKALDDLRIPLISEITLRIAVKSKRTDPFNIPLYTHPVKEQRCSTCDGTGDVHSIDGQWLGECPWCTHPVKELTLTKEEIHAVWASGEYYTLDKDGSIDEFHFADFAKAILRKAQEK